jgi:hypothetical protein
MCKCSDNKNAVVKPTSSSDAVMNYFNGTSPVAATFAAANAQPKSVEEEKKSPTTDFLNNMIGKMFWLIAVIVLLVWNRKKILG